ncbi:glycosyltransferase family 2 protein [Engelhardtia mirabilis]|uniref:Undecaprenyl-phosphate mannosyltransferase n=1 Tax=Engelhardtia mirabilis TaxID=2528011 RepID=A0A518BQ18_9BACT|nr:Undecaprenyl-phosphate mannosyltransferase [Planctomycetes bacterium Pla133]QDV03385.1 Undecaprenyl-phosphate mannosyltransferase [Planctomycetes bacterium Pla86]
MFRGHRVTVVVPAYNEEATIAEVVAEFLAPECVDRVLVVDNNSRDRTAQLAASAGADVIAESAPGYGCAIRAGLDHSVECSADILVITEADGSFRGEDVWKLLYYLVDCQMVLGTRTTRQMVEQGANMDKKLRWGNVAMAKLLELFWYLPHEPRLTDVGCTFRALWADSWRSIRAGTREPGPSFSPEMICAAYQRGMRVIEVPVHYGARLGGESKHSASLAKVSKTALGMFKAICRKRFRG